MRIFSTRPLPGSVETFLQGRTQYSSSEKNRPIWREELREAALSSDGLITFLTDPVDRDLLLGSPVRVVSNVAVGYDNIDVLGLKEMGVTVTHTPNVLTEATADLTFSLLLATVRRLGEARRTMEKGGWTTWSLDFLVGRDLQGLTLGLLGFGRIGQAVARRAQSFGMKVQYAKGQTGSEVPQPGSVPLRVLLETSNVLSLHCPLTPQTRKMMNSEAFGRMHPGSYFINTARGGLVDEEALLAALSSGHLAGAGLDVFETEPLPMNHPFFSLPQVVLTPHIGSATRETRLAMAQLAAENILAALDGSPQNVVRGSDRP